MFVALAACAAALMTPAVAASAATDTSTAVAHTATVTGCSTYQYNTDPNMPIYSGAGTGTGQVDSTYAIGIVNVYEFNGDWRKGNFYWIDRDGGAHFYRTGWIHISHIHYVRCW